MVDMMFPERFLEEHRLLTVTDCRNFPNDVDGWIFFLQFCEISQSLEHVCSQAANPVVGQVARNVKRQMNVLAAFESRKLFLVTDCGVSKIGVSSELN